MPPLMTSSRHELFECSLDHCICLMNPYLKIPGRSLVGTSSGGYISPDLPDSASKPRTSSAMSAVTSCTGCRSVPGEWKAWRVTDEATNTRAGIPELVVQAMMER